MIGVGIDKGVCRRGGGEIVERFLSGSGGAAFVWGLLSVPGAGCTFCVLVQPVPAFRLCFHVLDVFMFVNGLIFRRCLPT